ncbi:Putative AMP-dependent synthetase/ligase domain, fatty acyl-coenzyme A reductase, NAD-binding [Colletotrichum destructivum]|uniref:AMP-dependent synthetase/ligase domain, fatty acyl-coenzyme A reductase, NAD-binding n=1 Tax=Colletotrichum destructivum TaxID=34406 RepID=A0AAX4IMD5_9PEZI|nr:Putative AMP-dependent synthetase/ligase domain, fatty acyl-coenzyme A reductase, NAD-binding [Colletotrichum destructivum]
MLEGLRLTNCTSRTDITADVSFQSINLDESTRLGDGEEVEEEGKAERQLQEQFAVSKALPNYTARILNPAGKPQPIHYTGEIYISSKGVAMRSYLGLPKKTRKKFFSDPSSSNILYRSGDSSQLLSHGTLLCFGRLEGDLQIKLRGLRLELEEVETALLGASKGLLSTIVVSRDRDYFMPAAIIPLNTLPTSPNGKFDRKAIAALAPPATAPNSTDQVQAAWVEVGEREEEKKTMNIREGELSLLWEWVLPSTATIAMGRVTPLSEFFMRGGNFMPVMRLQALISESMGVNVMTRTLFRAGTLKAMAKAVFSRRDVHDAAAAEGRTEEMNLEKETEVPEWLKGRLHEMSSVEDDEALPVKSEGLNVVLTGAAGFFGGRILNALLQSPAVRTVHCIALDDDDDDNSHSYSYSDLQKIISSNTTTKTVQTFRGSLADPKLGLTPSETRLIEGRRHHPRRLQRSP